MRKSERFSIGKLAATRCTISNPLSVSRSMAVEGAQ
jgi:hypothetical protein